MKFRPVVLLLLCSIAAVSACKKTIHYPATAPADYCLPLEPGKYAIYRLDSLNFYYYGQLDTVTSYLAKDSVEESFTDGEGNKAWYVTRYLSDTTGQTWYPSETYTVTPSASRLEMTEDNLRFIKLAFPITQGFSWSGSVLPPAMCAWTRDDREVEREGTIGVAWRARGTPKTWDMCCVTLL